MQKEEKEESPNIVYHEITETEDDDSKEEEVYTIEQVTEGEYEIDELPEENEVGAGGGEEEFTLNPNTSKQIKSHFCPNCGNCYGAAGSLKLHIRACLKQKETEAKDLEARKCQICGKVYNSISYLKEHLLRHSGKGPRKCHRCNRKFLDDEKFDAHVKTHENEPNETVVEYENSQDGSSSGEKKVVKQYTCSFCQKKFTVVFDSRFTKRRYACDECRERFTNEEELKRHKESLEEKKEFRCQRCGRVFVFEGFLQRHAPTCDGTVKKKRLIPRDSN